MGLPIVKGVDDKILRTVSKAVKKIDKDLVKLLPKMVDTMHEANGVGLAAPQIGLNIRVFVMKIFGPSRGKKIDYDNYSVQEMINPEIIEMDKRMINEEEGCLSVPGVFGEVDRHARLKVRFQNKKGMTLLFEFEGLNARIVQHETDHLNGILCVDKMKRKDTEPQSPRLKKREEVAEKTLKARK